MAIKQSHSQYTQTYFCTFTCKDWLHLFYITNLYDELYNWFNILISRNNQLEAFVLMPNHLHLLLFTAENENINMLIANGKRFLAYEIIKRLENNKEYKILHHLEKVVTEKEKQRKKKHRVFEVSSDIKPCYTEAFLLQKLDYIHNNPISAKWNLADIPEQYLHSSAGFYIKNEEHPFVKLTHWRDVGKL